MPTRSAATQLTSLQVSAGQAALDRLLADPSFRASERNRRFLRFVTQEYLKGQGDRIKSYIIGVDVFGRGEDFNPAIDPIVRIEANRLRAALAAYYAGPGRTEHLRIDLPKGGYVPTISEMAGYVGADIDDKQKGVPAPTTMSSHTATSIFSHYRLPAVVTIVLALSLYAIVRHWNQSSPEVKLPAIFVSATSAKDISSHQNTTDLGFARSILTALSRFEGIRVFWLPQALSSADAIAKLNSDGGGIGSAYLLEAGIRDQDQSERFWWTLKNARTGEVIWSDQIDQPAAQGVSITIEDQIAANIAKVVGQPLGLVASSESQADGQLSLNGYDCVLKARAYFIAISEPLHSDVRTCLEQTVAASPNYAEAHALLAWMYLEEDRNGFNLRSDHDSALAAALQSAQRAAELAPRSATAQEALMAIYYRKGDFDTAFEYGHRAIVLNPHNPELAGSLGTRLFARGHWDEGAALVRESIQNSLIAQPLDRVTLVLDAYRRGAFAEALDQAQQLGIPGFYGQWALLAAIYGKLGNKEEAATAVAELIKLRPRYAEEMRNDMQSRHYTEPMIDMVADGLLAAGLPVK